MFLVGRTEQIVMQHNTGDYGADKPGKKEKREKKRKKKIAGTIK